MRLFILFVIAEVLVGGLAWWLFSKIPQGALAIVGFVALMTIVAITGMVAFLWAWGKGMEG